VLCKRYLDLSDVRRVCRVVVADRCEIAGVVRLHRPPAPYGATVWPMSPAAAAAVVTDELGYVDPGFPTDWLGVLEGTAPTPRPDVTGVAGLETWVPPGSAESYDAVRRWLANDLTLSGTAGDGEGNG
jgi:hypothetical protein